MEVEEEVEEEEEEVEEEEEEEEVDEGEEEEESVDEGEVEWWCRCLRWGWWRDEADRRCPLLPSLLCDEVACVWW